MENINNKKTYEYVFDYISSQILTGELRLNDKMPTEREIAGKLGVSRNSVREVMHMLEITGLIECIQGSGNYVKCNPQEYMLKSVNMVMSLLDIDYTEIFHLRMGYEFAALRLAMKMATEAELEKLHLVVKKMDEPMSVDESARLDSEFHRLLIQASHNRMLILYSSMLNHLMDKFIVNFRTEILKNRIRAKALRNSHWGIYNSLADRDMEAAMKAFDEHFLVVGEQLDKISK